MYYRLSLVLVINEQCKHLNKKEFYSWEYMYTWCGQKQYEPYYIWWAFHFWLCVSVSAAVCSDSLVTGDPPVVMKSVKLRSPGSAFLPLLLSRSLPPVNIRRRHHSPLSTSASDLWVKSDPRKYSADPGKFCGDDSIIAGLQPRTAKNLRQ